MKNKLKKLLSVVGIASFLSCPAVLNKVCARDYIMRPEHVLFFPYCPDIITNFYSEGVNTILLKYFNGYHDGDVAYENPDNSLSVLEINLGPVGKLTISSDKWFIIRMKSLDGNLTPTIEYRTQDLNNHPTVIFSRND